MRAYHKITLDERVTSPATFIDRDGITTEIEGSWKIVSPETEEEDKFLKLVKQIAALTPDGHCGTHGAYCEVDSCEDRFDMPSEDAIATVNALIYAAIETLGDG